jgi:hypothetical protein
VICSVATEVTSANILATRVTARSCQARTHKRTGRRAVESMFGVNWDPPAPIVSLIMTSSDPKSPQFYRPQFTRCWRKSAARRMPQLDSSQQIIRIPSSRDCTASTSFSLANGRIFRDPSISLILSANDYHKLHFCSRLTTTRH